MNTHFRWAVLVALAACTVWLPAYPSPHVAAESSVARLTEAHGQVYKRGFRDWQKLQWEDPEPAATGDVLTEGMQLGTGDRSWAQLTWPNVTTRAWSNSVYAIAPNKRLVYLLGGEMLYHLDKKRKDKDPYYIWTNLLQARIRGTTVLCQSTPISSRITVLEGCIDVMNRLDHSVVRLKPGVVYEVTKRQEPGNPTPAPTTPTAAAPASAPLTSLTLPQDHPIPLFETSKTVSTLTAVNPQAILGNPLLGQFSDTLTSLPLVDEAMLGVSNLLSGQLNVPNVDKVLKASAEIISVPVALGYDVDKHVAQLLGLPASALEFFPPQAMLHDSRQPYLAAGSLTPTLNPQALLSQPQSLPPSTQTVLSQTQGSFMSSVTSGQLSATLPGGISSATLASRNVFVPTANPVAGVLGASGGAATGLLGGTVSGALSTVSNTVNSGTNLVNGLLNGLR